MRSWGNVITEWSVSSSGDGFWSGQSGMAKAGGSVPPMIKHDLTVGPAKFRELEAMVRKLPSPAPNSSPCKQFMTDQPYGTIRMTSGATTTEIGWNAGCMDKTYLAFLNPLRAVNDTVKSWGEKSPVIPD